MVQRQASAAEVNAEAAKAAVARQRALERADADRARRAEEQQRQKRFDRMKAESESRAKQLMDAFVRRTPRPDPAVPRPHRLALLCRGFHSVGLQEPEGGGQQGLAMASLHAAAEAEHAAREAAAGEKDDAAAQAVRHTAHSADRDDCLSCVLASACSASACNLPALCRIVHLQLCAHSPCLCKR